MQQALEFEEKTASEIANLVIDTVRQHLRRDSRFGCVACAWSAGKDSSVMVALTLEAARLEMQENGYARPIVIMNSDTRVENPLVAELVTSERAKMVQFAQTHGLTLHVVTGRPSLAASWAVKVIAGNALPPQPGGKNACTTDWKIEPMRRAMNDWARAHGMKEAAILKLTGTRFSESQERGRKMALRGESAREPSLGPSGEWILSPIADLDTDQVWEIIAGIRSGELPAAYTDFDDLLGVYSSAGGSSCPLLADYRMGGADLGQCEARTGCYVCTKVERDNSLESMLDEHPWMKPLYALREWVAAIMWDYSKRSFVGRTIDAHGYIKIAPDGLDSKTTADLLRFALSIDADEDAWAQRTGARRRFAAIIPLDALILIDFGWSMGGTQDLPYEAWRIYRDVVEDGARYYPPELPRAPRQELPQPRYLHVGEGWEKSRTWWGCGLRDLLAEALESDTASAFPMRILNDGREILDIDRADTTSVDLESIDTWDYLQFLHWDNVEAAARGRIGHAEAVRIYLQFGVVKHPDHGQLDTMLRRVAYRQHMGIGRNRPAHEIMAQTISEEEHALACGMSEVGRQMSMNLEKAA